jgi:hypothetical protein
VLEDGTPVKLRIARTVSSADAHVGDTVDFEVLEEVKVGKLLVIAKGGTAWATVTEAEAKKRMARGGKLNMNIDAVRLVDGEKAALRAVKEVKGGGHTGAMSGGMVATAIVFFPAAPFFLFMHGKDISIPKGTEITAYVNGNFGIDVARFQDPGQNSQSYQCASSAGDSVECFEYGHARHLLDAPDADIELDGSFAGNTPSSIGVAGGEHALRITKKGFVPWERKIRSSSGTIRVLAELEPLSATPASAGPAAVAPHQTIVSTTPAGSNPPEPTPELHPAVLSNAERPTTQAIAEAEQEKSKLLKTKEVVAAGPVSRILSAGRNRQDGHSSRPRITARLKRPTRRFDAPSRHVPRGEPEDFLPIWSCSVWGLPCLSHCCGSGTLLPHLFTLTPPCSLSRYPAATESQRQRGGMFSVALSVSRA